jgi:hypothetical protein
MTYYPRHRGTQAQCDISTMASYSLNNEPTMSYPATRTGTSNDAIPPVQLYPSQSHLTWIEANEQHPADLAKWDSLSARQRMNALCEYVFQLEDQFGPLAVWTTNFAAHWSETKDKRQTVYQEDVYGWFAKVGNQINRGNLALDYVGRIMEGNIHLDVEGCRALFLEAHEMSDELYRAIVALEHRLDIASQEYEAYLDLIQERIDQ